MQNSIVSQLQQITAIPSLFALGQVSMLASLGAITTFGDERGQAIDEFQRVQGLAERTSFKLDMKRPVIDGLQATIEAIDAQKGNGTGQHLVEGASTERSERFPSTHG